MLRSPSFGLKNDLLQWMWEEEDKMKVSERWRSSEECGAAVGGAPVRAEAQSGLAGLEVPLVAEPGPSSPLAPWCRPAESRW